MKMPNDQAEYLRKKTAEIRNSENTLSNSLPSRSEVHGKKRENIKKKEQVDKREKKQTFLITRLLLFAFVILIGITVTYKYWSKNVNIPVHGENNDIEQVKIER